MQNEIPHLSTVEYSNQDQAHGHSTQFHLACVLPPIRNHPTTIRTFAWVAFLAPTTHPLSGDLQFIYQCQRVDRRIVLMGCRNRLRSAAHENSNLADQLDVGCKY